MSFTCSSPALLLIVLPAVLPLLFRFMSFHRSFNHYCSSSRRSSKSHLFESSSVPLRRFTYVSTVRIPIDAQENVPSCFCLWSRKSPSFVSTTVTQRERFSSWMTAWKKTIPYTSLSIQWFDGHVILPPLMALWRWCSIRSKQTKPSVDRAKSHVLQTCLSSCLRDHKSYQSRTWRRKQGACLMSLIRCIF